MNTPPTPARQAALRAAELGLILQEHRVNLTSIITAAYAPERQQVREAIEPLIKDLEDYQTEDVHILTVERVAEHLTQLRDVLEKL